MVNHLTICIPKVANDIHKDFIFDVFNQYHFGKIKYIKIKKKNNISTAFVHYTYFNNDKKSQYVKNLLDYHKVPKKEKKDLFKELTESIG